MMVLAEPGITAEDISSLGRQMAGLFRQVNGNVAFPLFLILNNHQDNQLWEVKASQLAAWVDRGLLNVKLLDRTLAYFQNQSSFLQYIRALKKPVPKIESPGFPGTQWNEFYWKDQTVMLLMQVVVLFRSHGTTLTFVRSLIFLTARTPNSAPSCLLRSRASGG